MEIDKKKDVVVVKAATWYTISNIILRGISVFTAPIFTRLLTTSEYGIASNFTSWTSIVFCVSGLGLGTSIVRGKIEFKEDYKKYVSAIQFLGMITTIVMIAVMLPTLSFWTGLMELDKKLIIVMLIYLLVYPAVGFMQTNYRFDYRYKENIWISIFNAVGNVICSIGLILMYGEHRAFGRIIGTIIPVFILGLIFSTKIYTEGRCFYNKKYWKYAIKIGLPMIPHSLAMIVLGQIDRTMILKYCGSSDAGIYSFGYSYGILISVVTNALNDAIQPMIFEYIESKDKQRLNGLVQKTCSIISIMLVGVIAVGPEMLKILGTADYYSGRWIIYPVVIGTMFQFFYQCVACIEIFYKKTVVIAVGSVGAAIVNIVLNALFIPKYGFIAAGYTTLAGYLLLFLYHCIAARCVAGKKYIGNRVWLQASIFPVIYGAVMLYTYDEVIIRYLLFAVFMIVMFLKFKDEIDNLFRMVLRKRK